MADLAKFFLHLFIIGSVLFSEIRADAELARALECDSHLRRAQHFEVEDQFRYLYEKRFFGQDDAIDILLNALRRFREKDLLLLHFVGASGTGKTYLATIAQRSFFKLDQCRYSQELYSAAPGPIKSVLKSLPCIRTYRSLELPTIDEACGVGYADFLSFPDNTSAAKEQLESTLNRAFLTRKEGDTSPVLLLLDNFNYCKGICEQLMTKIATTRRFRLRNNREVRLQNVVILITSDLTQEGLRLSPNDDKITALNRILEVVRNTWGEESLWNDRAHVVPFLPYTDAELVKIVELTINDVKEEIRQNLEEMLDIEKERLNLGYGSTVRWIGRFKLPEHEKLRLIDLVHVEVAKQNCRAFERIKGKLIAASRRPEPIETRLLRHRPYVRETKSSWVVGTIAKTFQNKKAFQDVQYTQNILIKVVDDARMVVMEVEDIDDFPPLNEDNHDEL